MLRRLARTFAIVAALGSPAFALEKPDITYKIFQFPANAIPRVDGDASDWSMVPAEYVVGTDQLVSTGGAAATKPDPASIDVKVRVGWVKGLNRLYFLYEAQDNYWDFSRPGLPNDTFEIVVDGDRSGGPLIERFHPEVHPQSRGRGSSPTTLPADRYLPPREGWFDFQNHHAQNYHIFTPAEGKDWCMAWGPQASWIKGLPWSNIAYNYTFKQGEAGKLTMEFWITPFDYAGSEGPSRAVETKLEEGKLIGLAWAVLDYDDANNTRHGFWNLSPKHTMYGQANELCAFRLMPVETRLLKKIDANWTFQIVDLDRRAVVFKDESVGKVTKWHWDFGDGKTSDEQHPVHVYAEQGQYVVVLSVEGPDGKSRLSKVWDVTLR